MLAGVFLTADCLSEEKREGTLGLLFLTDLKGYDVVLGKLVATSLHSVYGLLAIFPILGLPLLLGGITGGEFARVMLALLVTLFFSLTSGLFISAISREARQAMTATLGVILLASVVLPIAYAIARFFFKTTLISPIQLLSPISAYSRAFDSHYHTRVGPDEFWSSLGVLFGLSFGMLVLAMRILPARLAGEGADACCKWATGKIRQIPFWRRPNSRILAVKIPFAQSLFLAGEPGSFAPHPRLVLVRRDNAYLAWLRGGDLQQIRHD